MKFKNCQLIIGGDTPSKENIKNIYKSEQQVVKDYNNDWYEINKEFVDDRFLFMYCEYDNAELYNDTVLNGENDAKETNPRSKSQVELRKQLFICYDVHTNLLYINNLEKRGFIKYYISVIFNKKVDIKNIYSSLEDFQSTVKIIQKFKFVQKTI